MVNKFIHKDFYLHNELAEQLYHDFAKDLPAIDFHNHLNPKHLADNKVFGDIAEAWIVSDPYKHRAMRICGVAERGVTGESSSWEKFLNWAKVVPQTVGNPLFLWSSLELKRVFDIDESLSEENAKEVWEYCNKELQKEGCGAVNIVKKFNIEVLCTSDDLLDDLKPHSEVSKKRGIEVFPSLRGDTILAFDQPSMSKWLINLEEKFGSGISNLDNFKAAIIEQLDKFSAGGCQLADHAIDGGFKFHHDESMNVSDIFTKWIKERQLAGEELLALKRHLLSFLSMEYSKRDWILQLHIGAQRFTSSRLRNLAGASGGYAGIGRTCDIAGLCNFFDQLEKESKLPRLILYTLNSSDNEVMAAITGSYTQDGVWGKVQFGPAWWYNDHYSGIKSQLSVAANYSLISKFIGMTTDSRSVFSFSRHEYFRRILCGQISEWVEQGHLPHDIDLLSRLVQDISYFNSKKWIFKD
ncbi:glucuronate isomerase [Membranihabitans maritimus]|uniref:glucuronate isomerase n=1 Tax=Membranihabitans maritimus TaxID=2904244 RepID=UPI001F022AA1|nr:glucuronate isomerase [Membranihabitans maritimus]